MSARVVLPCAELGPTLEFFLRLGFRVEAISPADAPTRAILSGQGLRIELCPGPGDPGLVRLVGEGPDEVAPNGTRIERVPADPPVVVPPLRPELAIARSSAGWST